MPEDTRTMKILRTAEKLSAWKKIVVAVPTLAIAALGLLSAGEMAWNAVKGFGPLETQFREHRGEFTEHVEAFDGHEEAHSGEHGEFHALSDTLLRSLDGLVQRFDTVRLRQEWILCLEGQQRDRDAGRPVRDCTPYGGPP